MSNFYKQTILAKSRFTKRPGHGDWVQSRFEPLTRLRLIKNHEDPASRPLPMFHYQLLAQQSFNGTFYVCTQAHKAGWPALSHCLIQWMLERLRILLGINAKGLKEVQADWGCQAIHNPIRR